MRHGDALPQPAAGPDPRRHRPRGLQQERPLRRLRLAVARQGAQDQVQDQRRQGHHRALLGLRALDRPPPRLRQHPLPPRQEHRALLQAPRGPRHRVAGPHQGRLQRDPLPHRPRHQLGGLQARRRPQEEQGEKAHGLPQAQHLPEKLPASHPFRLHQGQRLSHRAALPRAAAEGPLRRLRLPQEPPRLRGQLQLRLLLAALQGRQGPHAAAHRADAPGARAQAAAGAAAAGEGREPAAPRGADGHRAHRPAHAAVLRRDVRAARGVRAAAREPLRAEGPGPRGALPAGRQHAADGVDRVGAPEDDADAAREGRVGEQGERDGGDRADHGCAPQQGAGVPGGAGGAGEGGRERADDRARDGAVRVRAARERQGGGVPAGERGGERGAQVRDDAAAGGAGAGPHGVRDAADPVVREGRAAGREPAPHERERADRAAERAEPGDAAAEEGHHQGADPARRVGGRQHRAGRPLQAHHGGHRGAGIR